MKLLRLSWRNIWRNRRRTVISIASVFFAVFFCIIMMGFEEGVWDSMIDGMLRTQTGHIQIHARGYWDDKITDNFMTADSATIMRLGSIDNIENVSPRLETFAMASYGTVSKGIAIIGVSPEKESQKSNLPSRIVRGDYLTETDDGILIGEGLSKYLKATIGDTIALIGQGYHGASAAQLFPVRGILKMMTTEMNNGMAYVTLPAAQQFIDMPNGYSGILISVKDNKKLNETMRVVSCQLSGDSCQLSVIRGQLSGDSCQLSVVSCQLSVVSCQLSGDSCQLSVIRGQLSGETENYKLKTENYEILSWHFTMERLLQTSESDKAFGNVIIYILYVIVGFGILGTVIMMTNERKQEFCMMISLGMARLRLASVIAVELVVMSLIGVVLAFIFTVPIAHWFAAHPVEMTGDVAAMYADYGIEPLLPMSVAPYIFVNQMITVLVIATLAIVYPVYNILKLKITTKS